MGEIWEEVKVKEGHRDCSCKWHWQQRLSRWQPPQQLEKFAGSLGINFVAAAAAGATRAGVPRRDLTAARIGWLKRNCGAVRCQRTLPVSSAGPLS